MIKATLIIVLLGDNDGTIRIWSTRGIDSDSIISQLLAQEEQRIFMIQRHIAEEESSGYEDLWTRASTA